MILGLDTCVLDQRSCILECIFSNKICEFVSSIDKMCLFLLPPINPATATPMCVSISMIFSTELGSSKIDVKRFSTAKTTPCWHCMPIAVEPNLTASIAYSTWKSLKNINWTNNNLSRKQIILMDVHTFPQARMYLPLYHIHFWSDTFPRTLCNDLS